MFINGPFMWGSTETEIPAFFGITSGGDGDEGLVRADKAFMMYNVYVVYISPIIWRVIFLLGHLMNA